jgi:DNA-binding CsgD family transcriptional regulator
VVNSRGVSVCAQDSSNEFVRAYPVETCQVDRALHRLRDHDLDLRNQESCTRRHSTVATKPNGPLVDFGPFQFVTSYRPENFAFLFPCRSGSSFKLQLVIGATELPPFGGRGDERMQCSGKRTRLHWAVAWTVSHGSRIFAGTCGHSSNIASKMKVKPQQVAIANDASKSSFNTKSSTCNYPGDAPEIRFRMTLVKQLSQREQQVLEIFLENPNSDEIASTLGTSVQTVRNQLASIIRKLDLASREELLVTFLPIVNSGRMVAKTIDNE